MNKGCSLLAIAVCLLTGLATQTLVAWVLFIHSPYTGGTGVIRDQELKPGRRTDTGFLVPPDWHSRSLAQWWGAGKTRETVSEAIWVGSTLGFTSGGGRQATYQGFSAGWPLRSLCGCDFITAGLDRHTPVALVDPPAWTFVAGHKVPVHPLWIGLLVNTAIYSLPAFAVLWGWRYSTRRRRRQRVLCLQCGYPVRGLKLCPECGATALGLPT